MNDVFGSYKRQWYITYFLPAHNLVAHGSILFELCFSTYDLTYPFEDTDSALYNCVSSVDASYFHHFKGSTSQTNILIIWSDK